VVSQYPLQATIFQPAPRWDPHHWDQVTFYHGTTQHEANQILATGRIDLNFCRLDTDFGQGFYLTSRLVQAQHWAWLRYSSYRLSGTFANFSPVTMAFKLSRRDLSQLRALHFFVRGAYDSEAFWSFVQHCRQNPRPPHPPYPAWMITNFHQSNQGSYDVVSGPVASDWRQRQMAADTDQISFHTPNALALLNNFMRQNSRTSSWILPVNP
jgi:hypothetical protein